MNIDRPWGTFEVLREQNNYKVKVLTVNPSEKLSLQYHRHRSEHWVVVEGTALVQIGDKEFTLNVNESTYVPAKQKHRLSNPSLEPLKVIEVQSGDYLGEDDIVRLEDVYRR